MDLSSLKRPNKTHLKYFGLATCHLLGTIHCMNIFLRVHFILLDICATWFYLLFFFFGKITNDFKLNIKVKIQKTSFFIQYLVIIIRTNAVIHTFVSESKASFKETFVSVSQNAFFHDLLTNTVFQIILCLA